MSSLFQDPVQTAHDEISAALNKLRPLFTPDCELTFVMRKPGSPGVYMVISNDDLDEVIAVIEKSKARPKGEKR